MSAVKELFYKVFLKILIHIYNLVRRSDKLKTFGLWLLRDVPWIKTRLLKLRGFTHPATVISTDNADSIKSVGQLPETAREIYVLLCQQYKSRGVTL